MAEPVVVRPTARLIGAGWVLVVAGVVLLVGGWAAGFAMEQLTNVTAPLGWAALLAGVVLSGWAMVRKARNRDALQAQQAGRS